MTDHPTVEQQRVKLAPCVMGAAKAIGSDASMPPAHRLVSVLMLVYGYAWFDKQHEIDPRGIALPEDQWREICGFLASGVPGDELNNVNLALSWMNQGPSGYMD